MKRTIASLSIAALLLTVAGCSNPQPAQEPDPSANPVIENIMARRSVRQYKEQAVPREVLQQIAECGVNAPNAMNAQEWEVRIIDDPEFLTGISPVMAKVLPASMVNPDAPGYRNAFRNATALIAVACPDDQSGMALINVGLLCENICLSAQSLGIGTVIMGGPVGAFSLPEAKPFLDKMAFSDGYKLRILIGLGYPDESPAARPRDLSKIRFVE